MQSAEAWADMLARMAGNSIRLNTEVVRVEQSRGRHARPVVLELERERSRIARDLHAGAGQPLAGIMLNLELLEASLAGATPATRDILTRLHNLAEAALEQIRTVSHRLQPPDWQCMTTDGALRALVASSGILETFETVVELAPLPEEPPHAVKVALYRCAQECISNIVRHSRATSIALRLTGYGDAVELRISDNGCGIVPVSRHGGMSAGMGLQSIRDQVRELGGICRIDSTLQGLIVAVRLPVSDE